MKLYGIYIQYDNFKLNWVHAMISNKINIINHL